MSATPFDLFIGIDYSGAQTPTSRLPGLQVYAAEAGSTDAVRWTSPTKSNNGQPVKWTRREVAQRLREEVLKGTRFLAGIDHGFSMPLAYFARYGLTTWPQFLDDFVAYWPTHEDHVYVDFVRDGAVFRTGGPAPGQRVGEPTEFRLAEQWTSSAKSVFQFDVQGQVAKSTHAGIPWLNGRHGRAGRFGRLFFSAADGGRARCGGVGGVGIGRALRCVYIGLAASALQLPKLCA